MYDIDFDVIFFYFQGKDEIKELQGRIKQLEEELDTTGEKLHETEVKLEEAVKVQGTVSRKVLLLLAFSEQ